MIEAHDLTKHYGRFIAADGVSFEIAKGEVVAFLGPNGAGKSTTLKMLTGYLASTRGKASICGFDVRDERMKAAECFGFLPENGPLYETMTPREMLTFIGKARQMSSDAIQSRIVELTDECALGKILDRPIYKLSKGNRQRVGMAQALIHKPKVLILDEPMTGLDPNQIHAMRELIKSFADEGCVLLSTHILQEVEALADKVVFISEGRIVFHGSVKEFKSHGEDLDQIFRSLTGEASAKEKAHA